MSLLTNIVAYWKLDESSGNAADATGNGFTLTNNNTVAYNAGIINNGADSGASNTNKWMNNASSLGLNTDSSRSMTISFWFNMRSFNTGDTSKLLNISKNGQDRLLFGVKESSGTIQMTITNVGGAGVDVTTTINTGTWYYFTATLSGNSIALYKNGSSIGTATMLNGATGSVDSFSLFREQGDTTYASAHIDEVGVWSRILTGAEITSLYNGGAGFQYPFTPTVNSGAFFNFM